MESGLTVLDTFCGAGGFSEGFRQAGYDVILGMDNWGPACETHEVNGFGGCRRVDLLEFGVGEVLALQRELEERHGGLDVLIGSPPCTEFSYAKKGGKGDIEKGMLLVRRHLLFAAVLRPRYWLMENVPRLKKVLDTECERSPEGGWEMPYERLGIDRGTARRLGLGGDALRIPKGFLLRASDFGACQKRTRFIAGDFPDELLDDQRAGPEVDTSLGGLLERLENALRAAGSDGLVRDPNYPHHAIRRGELRDHDYDTTLHPMWWEELRHLKRRHIQYGRMHFPDDLGAPARTVLASFNPSSREAIVLPTGRTVLYQGKERPLLRQPTVREVACVQGFPLSFQFKARSIADRYKLVGNAVPCQMAYALASAILDDVERGLDEARGEGFRRRARTTLRRREKAGRRPIIVLPRLTVDEADDRGEARRFRASPDKRIRRKLLSSKLEEDSSVVVFENTELSGGRRRGGPGWKACVQRGVGKRYSKVYLDETSVTALLRSLRSSLALDELRDLLRGLLEEARKGVPWVGTEWEEFPGWNRGPWEEGPGRYLPHIGDRRLRLPSVSLLQRLFTHDVPETGDVVGPIDLFDGLDAMMLLAFDRHRDLRTARVYVGLLRDGYPHGPDPNVVPEIRDVEMPVVTVMGALLSSYVLHRMYSIDDPYLGLPYAESLGRAVRRIEEWCGPQKGELQREAGYASA